MDWLSYYRAVIDCYEKIVRIPLPNDEILEVQGERPEKDFGSLACIKADEKKLDDIHPCQKKNMKVLGMLVQPYTGVINEDPSKVEFGQETGRLLNRQLEIRFDSEESLVFVVSWYEESETLLSTLAGVLRALRLKPNIKNPQDYFSNQKSQKWKWEKITMDLVTKVAIDCSSGTKNYLSTALPPCESWDGQNSEHTIQTLEDMLRACVMDFGGSWDTHLPSPAIWTKVGESQLIGPELVQETTEKIFQIKERLKTARSRQKSYVDKRRKPLEFKLETECYLSVLDSSLSTKVTQELSCVHDTFHVSNLKKCLAEPDVQVALWTDGLIKTRDFVEESIEIDWDR
ncbi:hypothetical protein Tco_1312394 [Tanacetum coccineum]